MSDDDQKFLEPDDFGVVDEDEDFDGSEDGNDENEEDE